MGLVKVNSPNVVYGSDSIISDYQYQNTLVEQDENGAMIAKPISSHYTFETKTKLPKLGLMLVGWGGNNGSTVTAAITANQNKMSWRSREGVQKSNYWGSLTQAATVRLGVNAKGEDVYVPLHDLVPLVHPNDFVLGGWDINGANLAEAMERAKVLEPDLQRQLYPLLKEHTPLPSIYYPDYIAANQEDRADNLLPGNDKQKHLEAIRKQIRDFKAANQLDTVVVLWTANTERYSSIIPGVNDTMENLLHAIETSHEEVAPSTVFAVACILEHVPFINGSPQNTFVPGALELAEREHSFIGGDDFKSGQTKMKSVMVDFLVGAGMKPLSIVSYNHLGNNDGKNLSAPSQFRSKEISKSNVVDDMVASNNILYEKDEHPDHVVVIKYVPAVGDSKRAMDEYVSEIFMGGRSTVAMHNTCEDSFLAAPLIIDLAILTELMTRVTYKTDDMEEPARFHSVLSILSYLLKAPMVPPKTPVVNALSKQRAALENIIRALIGLMPQNDMLLEHKAC